MKLYYLSGACSLASNIALREAGSNSSSSKWTGTPRRPRRPGLQRGESQGLLPTLTLDNGEVLTENVTVLQYIADRNPAAKLAPAAGTMERYRLMEWLSFINSEVHKGFSPLFRQDAPEDTKQYARKNLVTRFDYLERALGSRSFLMASSSPSPTPTCSPC